MMMVLSWKERIRLTMTRGAGDPWLHSIQLGNGYRNAYAWFAYRVSLFRVRLDS